MAEIFQIRGSYEHAGAPREAARTTPAGWFLQDAWARGIVIGVIASPDYGGGYEKACVFAPELGQPSILDSLRARHCYGTTAAKVSLDVRVLRKTMNWCGAARSGSGRSSHPPPIDGNRQTSLVEATGESSPRTANLPSIVTLMIGASLPPVTIEDAIPG